MPARRNALIYLIKLRGLRKNREQSEMRTISQSELLRLLISSLNAGRFALVPGGTIIRINADNFVTVLPCEVQAEGFLLFVGSKVGPCGSGVDDCFFHDETSKSF